MMRLFLLLFFFIAPLQANLRVINADFGFGYREDHLDWSFAGWDNKPNILSELEWNHVRSREMSGSLDLAYNSIMIRGALNHGRIYSGQNRDSDYEGDNRTDVFVRSISTSDKGEVFDLSGGIGCCYEYKSFTFVPLIGWSLDEQNLRDRKGLNLIDTEHPAYEGKSFWIHSQYYAHWHGPWIGIDVAYNLLSKWLIEGSVECHWVRYFGRGHWNLVHQFARDFEQTAIGYGIVGSLNVAYFLTEYFSFGVGVTGRKFKTGKGRDRKFYNKDKDWNRFVVPVKVDLRFNGANWESLGLKAYISCSF